MKKVAPAGACDSTVGRKALARCHISAGVSFITKFK